MFMRRWFIVFLFCFIARAQELSVTGKITYISSGTVYISVGRANGLRDSTLLYVVAGRDTVAALKVFAVSSKSSACTVLGSKRDVIVGDNIVGLVRRQEEEKISVVAPTDTTTGQKTDTLQGRVSKPMESSMISVQGRVSFQYYTAQFDNSDYNLNQPGLILSLRASAKDIPLTMEVYGNLRSVSRGGMSPFSGNSANESRIYRLSLEYDDQLNVVTLGRILPLYSPSIGSIDGVSFARRFGNFTAGGSIGFQPSLTLQGTSTDTKKMSLFARYQEHEFYDLTFTAAYARTYVSSQLDREAVSIGLSAYSTDGLSVYAYGDVDVRAKNGDHLELSPFISSAFLMINYRLADFLTLGIGADASRPVYPFFSVQSVPDSLLDHKSRSGATLSLTATLANGLGLYNTFTPRSSDEGFGRDYTNYSSLYWSDALSSGAMMRGTFMLTANSFTTARGFGIHLQRNFFGMDCTIRYQQSRYTTLQFEQSNVSQSYGVDLAVLLTRQLSWIVTFDALRGYGSTMNSIFTELSWRF